MARQHIVYNDTIDWFEVDDFQKSKIVVRLVDFLLITVVPLV